MKTTDGSARNGDKHHRKNGTALILGSKTFPHLGQGGLVDKHGYQQAKSHKQQRNGKQRINPPDDFIDRTKGSHNIIDKNNNHPKIGIHPHGSHASQQFGRTGDEHGSNQHHQHHGKNGHHLTSAVSQVSPYQLRQALPIMTKRKSTTEEIVYSTGKNSSKHNPQVRSRSELRPHNGTENRTKPGNVEKLNHKNLPVGKYQIIHPVSLCISGCFPVYIRFEDTLHKASVNEISPYQKKEGQSKCNHNIVGFRTAKITI